jgi:hypothetical protein
LAILVLPTTNWPEIQKHLDQIPNAVNGLQPGDYLELHFRKSGLASLGRSGNSKNWHSQWHKV